MRCYALCALWWDESCFPSFTKLNCDGLLTGILPHCWNSLAWLSRSGEIAKSRQVVRKSVADRLKVQRLTMTKGPDEEASNHKSRAQAGSETKQFEATGWRKRGRMEPET